MKLKYIFTLILSLFSTIGIVQGASDTQAAKFDQFKFRLLDTGSGHGKSTFFSDGGNSFQLKVENVDNNNYGVICSDFQYSGPAQQKLVFRVKGAPENGAANLSVTLGYLSGGKWVSRSYSGIPARSSDFNRIVLALDRDFQLGDARYDFVQLKFGFGGGPKGSVSTLFIDDVRIVNAEDLNSGADFNPVIVPIKKTTAAAKAGVRVFFDFDNDDLKSVAQCQQDKPVSENVSPNSFAHQLLAGTDGLLQETDSPANADVIVSSRIVSGSNGQAIADAVKRGAKLLIYGIPADPEVIGIAPMKLRSRSLQGFPVRESLHGSSTLLPPPTKERTLARYFDADIIPGTEVLLSFPNGQPYAVRKNNVIQFASGIANQLDGISEIFYDRGLLKLMVRLADGDTGKIDAREKDLLAKAAEKETRLVEDVLAEAGIPASEKANWHVGMSENNIGRFGWLIGESLLHSTVSGDLAISNNSGVFRLFSGANRTFPITAWTRKVVKGNIKFEVPSDPLSPWQGEGVVQYDTVFPFDAEWQGKPIFFEVREGIDDTDEVFLNGKRIGGIDEKTPYYWMAPRHYPIAESLVNWKGDNRISVRITNLRGGAGFNSKPQVVLAGGAAPLLSVPKADWVGKRYVIEKEGKSSEMEFSLLSPFIRFRFPQDKELNLTQENLCDYAMFDTAKGRKIIDLSKVSGPLYDRAQDGKLDKPFLLLFRKDNGRPFLLVFQHNPDKIVPQFRGTLLESFLLSWPNAAGEVFAGWPFGIRDLDTGSWSKAIPLDIEKKIEFAAERALSYPEHCDELYSIDRTKGTVEILNRFRYRQPSDDWNTPLRATATLPPLVTWMLRAGKLVSCAEPLRDFDTATNLGATFGRDGSCIRYSLPLPDRADFIPVGVTDQEFFPEGNRHFADGVKYSAGGATPFERWTPRTPYGPELPMNSICQFRWNFGLGAALHGTFCLSDENRTALENRTRIRFQEPLELFQHKYFARHRREPFSGLDYPIFINAFFPNTTRYSAGFGSQVNYGDANEACILVGWVGQQLADFLGQKELARSCWPYFRYGLKYQTAIDDYAFMSGSCRETGIGAWIDMLNGEFSGMLSYARLAELAGDRRTAEDCLYRAAKRTVPTLARLYPGDEVDKIFPESKGRSYQLTGFSDSGPCPMYFPNTNGNALCANDLFDFSEGFPGALIALYFKYGLDPVREHLDKRAWPNLMERSEKLAYLDYAGPFGAFGSREQALGFARQAVSTSKLMHDWPGIMRPLSLGCVLWNTNGKIAFRRLQNMDVKKAHFDPKTRILTIHCTADANSLMELSSEKRPTRVLRDGKTVEVSGDEKAYSLPLVSGPQVFELSF